MTALCFIILIIALTAKDILNVIKKLNKLINAMRKYFLFILTFLLQIISIIAKAQIECGSTFNPQVIQNSDPDRYNRYLQLEQFTANYIASLNKGGNINGRLINPNSTIIIPVVVHVLHNGEPVGVGNNISDAQIQSQIDVLNEDFRRLNAESKHACSICRSSCRSKFSISISMC
jgi:hypothetical protein